jgi:FKBP-type peptidyl-prolyl cis-trans isomerase (trigger factor)
VKTAVKKLDATKREMSIEVTGEVIKNKFEDVIKKISKEAKVPGFRPGHAPRDLIEKNFSGAIREQVLKELVPELYNQAIEKEALDVIELPDISDIKLDNVTLTFKATVETAPEIALKNYKKLKVSYKNVEVTPDDVKRSIDSLKESRKLDNLDDNFARGLGYPTLADLEKTIEKQLFLQKEHQQRQKMEEEIIEQLNSQADFKIPATLIERQINDMLRQTKIDLAMKGIPAERVDEREKELRKEMEPQAKKQVKTYLILSEIAKKEKIELNDHMPHNVMEFLLREAEWKG